MKVRNILLGLVMLVAILFMGSWEYSITQSERFENLPDSVYEYIYLKVGEGGSDKQILDYYDSHRLECDSVELANL